MDDDEFDELFGSGSSSAVAAGKAPTPVKASDSFDFDDFDVTPPSSASQPPAASDLDDIFGISSAAAPSPLVDESVSQWNFRWMISKRRQARSTHL